MNDQPAYRAFLRLAILTALTSIVPVHAVAQTGKPVVLENADSLVGKVIDGQDVRELIGNVRMVQENVRLRCDRALQFVLAGRVELAGNVVVVQDSMTFRAPRANYYRDERRAEGFDGVELVDGRSILTATRGDYLIDRRVATFRGNVFVRDSASTVAGDSLLYERDAKRSIVRGRVVVRHIPDRVVITGGRLDNDDVSGHSVMTISPLLLQLDSTARGRDTLAIRSVVMEAVRDSVRRFIATDSVRIVRTGLAALCGRALFFSQGDSVQLRSSPVIWYERTQVIGDSIDVFLQGRALNRINVQGSGMALSVADSTLPARFDQLTGETLRMKFTDKKLSRIDAESQAISIYNVFEDSVANGLNRTSGDRIVINFEQGKVRDVRVYGGVEGQYIPENLIMGREMEYRVPGFVWRTDRPTLNATLRPGPARPVEKTGRNSLHD